MAQCDRKVETYARVCGFMRPVQQWNRGKKEEQKDRVMFNVKGVLDETMSAAGGCVAKEKEKGLEVHP
jgi:hypothetical protein